MIKKIFLSGLMALALGFLSGCADKVSVTEALQVPRGGKIYTAYNLWYQDPDNISCVNVQKGKILPFGTEVTIVEATDRKVKFKDAAGTGYVIYYDPELMMLSMQSFVKQLFTLKNKQEQSAGIKPAMLAQINHGIVVPGMTRKEVQLAYGVPPIFRTPSYANDTWIYWIDEDETIRVIYSGEKVKKLLNIND